MCNTQQASGLCGGVEEDPRFKEVLTPEQPVAMCRTCHDRLHSSSLLDRLIAPIGLIVDYSPAAMN